MPESESKRAEATAIFWKKRETTAAGGPRLPTSADLLLAYVVRRRPPPLLVDMSPPGDRAGILLRQVDAQVAIYCGGASGGFWRGTRKDGRWTVLKTYTELEVLPELDLRWLQQQALDHLDDEQSELNALGTLAAGVIQAVRRSTSLPELREAAGHEVESSDGSHASSIPDLLGDRRVGRLLVGIPVIRDGNSDALYLEIGGWMRWKGAEVLRLSDAEVEAWHSAEEVKERLLEALEVRADSLLSRVTDVVRIRRALGSMKFDEGAS